MNVNYKLVGGQPKSVDTDAETVGEFLAEIEEVGKSVKMNMKDANADTLLEEEAILILTDKVKGGC